MPKPDNTPKRIPNLFDYNPYAKPVTPTLEFERLQNRIHKYQNKVDRSNKERKDEVSRLQKVTVFVYCKMCNGRLDRKKSISKDIGYRGGNNPSSDTGFSKGGGSGGSGSISLNIPIAITIPANEVFPERTIRAYIHRVSGSKMAQMS